MRACKNARTAEIRSRAVETRAGIIFDVGHGGGPLAIGGLGLGSLTDFYFPHNSTRKTYFPEDSRVYWFPHASSYRDSKIKPLGSDRDEFRRMDWLELLVKTARKGGWKTGAEISHTVLDKSRAASEFVSVVQRDIWGRPAGQLICPNNPVAMAYLLALFSDLVNHYDLDFVQTCLRPFQTGDRRAGGSPTERLLQTVTGTCFCDSCVTAAKADGFDLKAAQRAMLPLAGWLTKDTDLAGEHYLQLLRASNTSAEALLLRHPEIFHWLKFRCNSMTRMFARVHDSRLRARLEIQVLKRGPTMKLTRRALSAGLLLPFGVPALDAAATQHPDTPARRRATKVFKEVTASLYAWDLADQECEQIMETLKETTQANSLYLVALMHHEKRPLTDFYFPHNSTRKTYFPEDSRVYWFPHASSYRDSKIKPLGSDRDEFRRMDWLELLVKTARKGGWKTGAEISHTVLDKSRAASEFVSVVQLRGRPNELHGTVFEFLRNNALDANNFFTNAAGLRPVGVLQSVAFSARHLDVGV